VLSRSFLKSREGAGVAIAFRGSQRQGTFLLRAGSYSGVSMLG
jgi:hypothetical protein